MLRFETETGWWLVTHVDHARLAGEFAAHWGNEMFASPEPRKHVLKGISVHDDGWADRDAAPQITKQGKPSAFSVELIGKYSAFEEIDLEDYLSVRDRAVRLVAEDDPYAAILVSMHTYNLLSQRADRSTITADQLPLLDAFLDAQKEFQTHLYERILTMPDLSPEDVRGTRIEDHFRLLQATDNLSLLSCVSYRLPTSLLHPLALRNGRAQEVTVQALAEREFQLAPYPFDSPKLSFSLPARHVEGKAFESDQALQTAYAAAEIVEMTVMVTA